jgi:hypothetical protein
MNTAAKIISDSHMAAAVFDGPNEGNVRQTHRLAYLESALRKLVDKYEGVRDKRYDYIECELDGAPVLVEYEFDGGQRGNTSGPPEKCWEEIDPSVCIDQILINGCWISHEGVIDSSVIDKWIAQILEAKADQAREDYEDRQSERAYD